MDPRERTSRPLGVVTGATSGIGGAFADRLAREGYDLLLTGRRETLLEERARALEEAFGIRAETLRAELDRQEDRDALAARLRGLEVDLLVNNAGFGVRCPFVQTPEATWTALVDLHVRTPLALTQSVLPGMVARGTGRGGERGPPRRRSCRCPATGSTREPRPSCCAGPSPWPWSWRAPGWPCRPSAPASPERISTAVWGRRGLGSPGVPGSAGSPPEQVAEESLRGLRRGQRICVPGWGGRVRVALLGLLPSEARLSLLGRFFRSLPPEALRTPPRKRRPRGAAAVGIFSLRCPV